MGTYYIVHSSHMERKLLAPPLIRSLAKALGGSTTSLTSGVAGGGGGGGGGGSGDDAARSVLTKGYFKELLSAHFRQPDLKVRAMRTP